MTALDQSQASPAPLPSLKTLLVTDLVDSTKLTEKLGDRHAGEIYERHDRLARDLLLRFGGREIAKADGFTLIFERPIDAVCFALVYHDELAALSQELGTDAEKDGFRLAARVGIHLGEVVLRENPPEDIKHGARPIEMEGLAVSIVARVMSLAGGAQTLMTRAPFDLARRGAVGVGEVDDDIRWLEHGPYLFKGVSETMTVCEVGREGCAPLTPPPNSEKAERDIAPGDEKTLGWRPAPGLAIPERKGWKLERRLGVGGFGEVWLAEQKRTHEQRAFKFCFRADRLRSLKRELTLFRLIKEVLGDRRDIARLYDVQLDTAPFYLEMEYTAGGSLTQWAANRGGISEIPIETRLQLIAQIGEALTAAHSVGVIHKDVKPANILIQESKAGSLEVRLTDFGIGQLLTMRPLRDAGVTAAGFTVFTSATDLGSRIGTRLYMAPELLAGKAASIQSDVYSLGVLLYQMAVGDLERPLGHGWEQDIDDDLLREDIAASVAGSTSRRLRSANELSRRLRTLGSRRTEREMVRQRAVAEQEAEKIRFERAVRRERQLRWVIPTTVALALVVGVVSVAFLISEGNRRKAVETQKTDLMTAEQKHEKALLTTTRLQFALATLGGRKAFDEISARLRADGYADAARQSEQLARDVARALDTFRAQLRQKTDRKDIQYVDTGSDVSTVVRAVFGSTEATRPLIPFDGLRLDPTRPSPAVERVARHFVMQAEALDGIMEPMGPTIELGEGHQKYNDRICLIDVASTELIDADVDASTVVLRTSARLHKDTRPEAAFALQGAYVGVTLTADEVGNRAFSEYLNGLQKDNLPQALNFIGGVALPEGVTLENVRYAGDYALGELRFGPERDVKIRYSWDSGALGYVLDEEEATRRIRFVNAEDLRDAWSVSLDTVAPDSGAVGFGYFRACDLLSVSTIEAPETESPFVPMVNIVIGPGPGRSRRSLYEEIDFKWRVVMGAAGLTFDPSSAADVKTDLQRKLIRLASDEDFLNARATRALRALPTELPEIVNRSVESNRTPMKLVATVKVGGRERKYQWRFNKLALAFTDREEITSTPADHSDDTPNP